MIAWINFAILIFARPAACAALTDLRRNHCEKPTPK
jgi:hypothetical protein